jgi:hypothetical protein
MHEEKSVCVSFRVTPRFKRLLQAAAECEHRSQTNMLETLLFTHCSKNGVDEGGGNAPSRIKRGRKE